MEIEQPILIKWKDDKKAYFQQYQRKTFTCECGKVVQLGSKSNHMRTKDHKLRMYELASN